MKSSLSGNRDEIRAAITENFSIKTEMFWIGGRAGRGVVLGVWGGRSSREISDISTNSKSSILLLTLWTAAGLYAPLQDRLGGGSTEPAEGAFPFPYCARPGSRLRPEPPDGGNVGVVSGKAVVPA